MSGGTNGVGTNGQTTSQWVMAQAPRAVKLSLPLMSLYKPFTAPIAVGLGALRTVSSAGHLAHSIYEGKDRGEILSHAMKTTVSVISVAGTIFAHPIGMAVTAVQDLYVEVQNLYTHLKNKNVTGAAASCASILNNSLYLSLLAFGGAELTIAYLALQVLTGVCHVAAELRNKQYPEAIAHGAIVLVRGYQLHDEIQDFLAPELDIQSAGTWRRTFPLNERDGSTSIGSAYINLREDGSLQVADTTENGGVLNFVNLSEPGQPVIDPLVAYNERGDIGVIWRVQKGDDIIIQTASKPFGEAWSNTVNLTERGISSGVDFVLDTEGNAMAAWVSGKSIDGEKMDICVKNKPVDGDWKEDPFRYGHTTPYASQPKIVPGVKAEGKNEWTIVWGNENTDYHGTTTGVIKSAIFRKGAWSLDEVSVFGQDCRNPTIAGDGKGNVYAVWTTLGADNVPVLQFSRKEAGMYCWSKPVVIAKKVLSEGLDFRIHYYEGKYHFDYSRKLANGGTTTSPKIEIKASDLHT